MHCASTLIFCYIIYSVIHHFKTGVEDIQYLISDEERAKKCQMFLHHPNVRTYILKFKEQLAHNPFLQVATFIVIASLLTPILLFIMFAIISAVFIFIGFMMVQGKK